MKYMRNLKEQFSKTPTFSIRDVELFFSQQGLKPPYARQMLHQMVRRQHVHRITPGTYTFHPEMQIAGNAFQPYYYGLQDALSQHSLWDQETNPVIITPRKVRTGLRQFLGNNYLVRRIDRKLFFGYELMPYADFWIYVSDVEKTLIDFAYFKEPLDAQTLEEIKKRLEPKKLVTYLEKCPAWLRQRVNRRIRK